MKNSTIIKRIESSTLFNERRLVDFVTDNLLSIEPLPDYSLTTNFLTLAWASTSIPVKGMLEIIFENKNNEDVKRVNVPVDSWFFITCTKDQTGTCRVAWSNSLS